MAAGTTTAAARSASAGDVNGDGFADLIVGAPNGSAKSYVVFGGAFGATVTTTGTAAAEMLIGGSGNDTLTGGGGADVFHGGAGDDRLDIGDTTFLLADGGGGTDTLALDGAGVTLDLTDRLVAARVQGIERIDLAGSGNNTLAIDALGVLGGIGAVTGGTHVLVVEGDAGDTVLLSEGGWAKTGSFSDAGGMFDRYVLGDAVLDVEQGVSVPGATIFGTNGDDTISLSQTVDGQPLATNRRDVIYGKAGNDVLDGAGGDDVLNGGAGADALNGGTGIDRASYSGAPAGLTVDLAVAANNTGIAAGDTFNSIETLYGSKFADTLRGDGGANTIWGAAGNDMLEGGDGNDTLYGGAGADALNGGTGTDRAAYSDAPAGLTVDLAVAANNTGIAAGDTFNSIENLYGSKFADTLRGDGGANTIWGAAGDDMLEGGDGNDTLYGGAGADALNGGTGTDRVAYSDAPAGLTVDLAVAANNTGIAAGDTFNSIENLYGSKFADTLRGDGGANTIWGAAGNDTLEGGDGNDTLTAVRRRHAGGR